MGSILEHKRRIKEHFDDIDDAIDKGIENKPIAIGFHTSACAVELLETYLHKKNLISSGKTIKHNWFERPKLGQKISPLIERKLAVNFPDKQKIYELIYTIEENRDNLIYGKSTKAQIELVLNSFSALKQLLIKKLADEDEQVE